MTWKSWKDCPTRQTSVWIDNNYYWILYIVATKVHGTTKPVCWRHSGSAFPNLAIFGSEYANTFDSGEPKVISKEQAQTQGCILFTFKYELHNNSYEINILS